MAELNGRCLCGQVTWHYDGKVGRNLVCHCESCRRATSSAFGAFLAFDPAGLTWSGEITHFESSPRTFRGFCTNCGTRLYFISDNWPNEAHVHAATLLSSKDYTPTTHVVWSERAAWTEHLDALPKIDGFDT
jgi:hypothetical protein